MEMASLKNILVVDDDEAMLDFLHSNLTGEGYSCTTALDPAEADRHLAQHRFDLVLSDIEMPVKDGLQFMKETKRTFPELDFIIMTGYASDYPYVDIIEAGAADYMVKPFEIKELKARIVRIKREREILHKFRMMNEQLESAIERANEMALKAEMANIRLQREVKKRKKANEKIQLLSITDSLTGCYNRAYINEFLPGELKRAKRYGSPLSIVLCDIDHFKKVNDTYGHQAGDTVLQAFVACIRQTIRQNVDWIARFGGEEFLIVLPATGIDRACRMVERLQENLSNMVVAVKQHSIVVTSSYGIAGFDLITEDSDTLFDSLIHAADTYLYQAKHQGRNRGVSGPVPPSNDLIADRHSTDHAH